MSSLRTQFLEDLQRLENLMRDYKKGYPYNFGQVFRRYRFHIFCVVVALICFFVLGFCVGLIFFTLIVGWRLLARKMNIVKDIQVTVVDPTELERETVAAESKYAEYPDIVRFLQHFRAEWEAEKKKKKKIMMSWYIIAAVFLMAYIWLCWMRLVYNF